MVEGAQFPRGLSDGGRGELLQMIQMLNKRSVEALLFENQNTADKASVY